VKNTSLECDVLVVGGGAAGVPCAISAAREGARVVLLEEDPVVGGCLTDFYVTMLCGGPRTGFYEHARETLREERFTKPGAGEWFLPSAWLRLLDRELAAHSNIEILCGVRAERALVEAGRIAGVLACSGGREIRIKARVTIEATGTGALAESAGATVCYGRDARAEFDEPHAPETADSRVQLCTWMYVSQRMPGAPALDFKRLAAPYNRAFITQPGRLRPGEGENAGEPGLHLHWGCAVRCKDTRDSVALAAAQREALKFLEPDLALLAESGYAVHLAPRLGVREVRRVMGEAVLTENDLVAGAMPPDTVAIGDYPLDIWGEGDEPEKHALIVKMPPYGIPLGAMIPKGMEGLLVTGKCASGTHVAMSSFRVMPIVGQMGQAAGVAAALAAKRGIAVRAVDPADVRARLRGEAHGVALEEFGASGAT